MLFYQSEITRQRGLHRLSRGKDRDPSVEDLIARAELARECGGIALFGESENNIFRTFEDIFSGGHPSLRPKRRGNAVARRDTRMADRLIDMLRIVAPSGQTRSLRAGERQGVRHLLVGQAQQSSGCRRRAKTCAN
jgi:hypothetical protein